MVISPRESLTYADCLLRSDALARGLQGRRVERFGCAVDDAGDLLALLAASSATGSEACVYPSGIDSNDIADYASEFGHSTVIADRELALTSAEAIPLKALLAADADPPPKPGRSPFLILTTGTTGHRKGARHDWSRLVAAARHADETPGARWLLAYNLSQFAGVQVLLHVLASRATLVAPPSNRPREAIATMRDTGVTHVSATPTFWRLLTGVLDEAAARELHLQQITLGGEAVPAALIDRLRALWPNARISQVYGATEFGLALSVRDGRSGLPLSLLERGEEADVQVRIIDGQLHVRSQVGMLGYYGEEEEEAGWHPTGDLVEVRDERINFVGRASEVLNVGGVKVHPVPVEEVVGSVDGVELVRAYGRANPVTGQIVAIDVVAATGADPEALEGDIRAACERLPRAARPRRIKFVDALEVRGQKLARNEPQGDL